MEIAIRERMNLNDPNYLVMFFDNGYLIITNFFEIDDDGNFPLKDPKNANILIINRKHYLGGYNSIEFLCYQTFLRNLKNRIENALKLDYYLKQLQKMFETDYYTTIRQKMIDMRKQSIILEDNVQNNFDQNQRISNTKNLQKIKKTTQSPIRRSRALIPGWPHWMK